MVKATDILKETLIAQSRRKIKRHGFEGHHMFENALNENMGKVDAIFKQAGFDIAKELSE